MPSILCDHLVTRGLAELARQRIPAEVQLTSLEDAEAPLRLTRHVAGELFRALRSFRGEHSLKRQIELCNGVQDRLRVEVLLARPQAKRTSRRQVNQQGKRIVHAQDGAGSERPLFHDRFEQCVPGVCVELHIHLRRHVVRQAVELLAARDGHEHRTGALLDG
jgi:hypothetical protein